MSDTPELVGDGAQALVDGAKRLGLTWELRPATVFSVVNGEVLATYDGDTEPIGMVSLTGLLTAGDRVMVLEIPPAGNFIISLLVTPSTPALNRGTLDGVQVITGTLASGVTVETDLAELKLTAQVQLGRVYALDVQARVTVTATADDWLLRARLDTALSGTEVGQCVFSGFNLLGTPRATFIYEATATGLKEFFFSIGPSGAVTGTISVLGSSLPLNRTYASITDVGSNSAWRTA